MRALHLSRTAVPFWGQTTQSLSALPPLSALQSYFSTRYIFFRLTPTGTLEISTGTMVSNVQLYVSNQPFRKQRRRAEVRVGSCRGPSAVRLLALSLARRPSRIIPQSCSRCCCIRRLLIAKFPLWSPRRVQGAPHRKRLFALAGGGGPQRRSYPTFGKIESRAGVYVLRGDCVCLAYIIACFFCQIDKVVVVVVGREGGGSIWNTSSPPYSVKIEARMYVVHGIVCVRLMYV